MEDRGTKEHECLKSAIFLINNFLTLEDGRLRPKHVVFLKIFYKVSSVKNTLNIDTPHKDGTRKSEPSCIPSCTECLGFRILVYEDKRTAVFV
jgi:hypothetical protein